MLFLISILAIIVALGMYFGIHNSRTDYVNPSESRQTPIEQKGQENGTESHEIYQGTLSIIGATSPVENSETSRVENITWDIEANVLSQGVKFSKLPQESSRNIALHWIRNKDSRQLKSSDPHLRQHFILALFSM